MDRLPALAVMFVAFMVPARSAFAAWEVGDGALIGVGVLALVGFVLAAIFDAKLRRERRARARDVARLSEERRKQARALDGVPILVFHWPTHGITVGPSNCLLFGRRRGLFGPDDREIEDFHELAQYLQPDDFAKLNQAVSALRAEGTAFRLDLANLDGSRAFVAEGVGPSGEATEPGASSVSLWLRDSTTETQETHRVEAEAAALHARAMRLRTILDTVELPIWQRDAALDLVWCNQAYGDSVEAGIEAALKDGGIELASNISRAEARALSRNALASESQTTGRQHVVMNGERRLLEMVESPLADGRGTIGWARDITDFETARTDLLRHIDAHAEVLESLGTAISIYGPTQRLMFFNSQFVKLFQLDEAWLRSEPPLSEVLQAQSDLRRLPEQADWRAYREKMVALFTSVTDPIEELLHLPDGSTLRSVISPHPFGGLLFMTQDVTDRFALERSHSTLMAVQRATLDNLYEAVAVFGADGRLKLSNSGYAQMWNLIPSNLDGEPHFSEIVEMTKYLIDYGDDWETYTAEHMARLVERTRSGIRLVRRDDKVLDCTFVPLPDGATLITYLDVTDSFQVEQALRERTEALETADRLKTEFIANVSYELRTPLNTVVGFTEILANQYFGTLNERQQEYIKGILDSSQQLLSLINDILDLATVEAGLMVLEVEAIDVHAVLHSMLSLIQERIRRKQLNVTFECAPDIGPLEADERRLKQVLYNLLSNAMKFTPTGGTITLGAKRNSEAISIWVADTGVGIDRDEQRVVFDKFYQADSALARQSGAGLGLSLVKKFVELHGGRVELESVPEKGTTIVCSFPLRFAPQAVAYGEAEL